MSSQPVRDALDVLPPAASLTATAPTARQTELRVRLQLRVKLWGMGADGKPFSANAETVEVSGLGARLRGVPRVKEGEVVGIQYRDQRGRFRVIWTSGPGEEEQIGVQSLEGTKCIWAAALAQYNPVYPGEAPVANPAPSAAAS